MSDPIIMSDPVIIKEPFIVREPMMIDQTSFLEKNGTILVTMIGMVTACISGVAVYFLKSRCSEIRFCWGCIKCIREPLPIDMVEVSASPRLPNV